MATLSRFLSASGDKGYPYFQCLRRTSILYGAMNARKPSPSWNSVFPVPLFLVSQSQVPLFICILWLHIRRSSCSFCKIKKLVYFVSKVLQGPETRYQSIEKANLTVVFTAWRLCHYFQRFTVIVMTDLPIFLCLSKTRYSRSDGPLGCGVILVWHRVWTSRAD